MRAADALAIDVRVAADRTRVEVRKVCEPLRHRRGFDLDTPLSTERRASAHRMSSGSAPDPRSVCR
jgi:hypothetical protein